MFPAPGVYVAATIVFVMTVSACTTPLNFVIPADTVTIPADTFTCAAVIVTSDAACTVMPPASSLTLLPARP